MCLNIRSDMLKIRYAKIRLGPIWARAHMGQGPYGPGPIWARAHMGPGPLGPGPFLVGQTPHQKTHPGKKSPNCVFCVFFGNKKDARRPYDHFGGGIAPRSLLCVRKQRFPFCGHMSKFCVRFAKNDHREPCVTVCPSEK